ncbi:hypothetical protein NIASO_02600 [Niabella soli DSM 19437]|uniref:Transposase n=1 Tax=Niabella soli DSM 19437 TaxID=929713 RepID=W0F5Q8_9BACT|nr:hypothetical protein NIASO_02600 [Niabella soli DSM 19437]
MLPITRVTFKIKGINGYLRKESAQVRGKYTGKSSRPAF